VLSSAVVRLPGLERLQVLHAGQRSAREDPNPPGLRAGRSIDQKQMVEVTGLEPVASTVQESRSPN
jgi:hypothetical protein